MAEGKYMVYQRAVTGRCTSTWLLRPIIGFREFWSEWRFWAALSALALLQLPLVLALRAFVEKPGFPLLCALTILDCMFVILGLSYVCCTDESDTRRDIGKP